MTNMLIIMVMYRMLRTKYKIYRSTLQVEHYNAQVMGSCDSCQPLVR